MKKLCFQFYFWFIMIILLLNGLTLLIRNKNFSRHKNCPSEKTTKATEKNISAWIEQIYNVSVNAETSAKLKYLNNNITCPKISPFLVGRLREAGFYKNEIDRFKLKLEDVELLYPDVKSGGFWEPSICQANSKVAFIIPFRDRHLHLTYFLFNIIPVLKRQLINFRFIVVEQQNNQLFNKGRLNNAAFEFASNLGVDCVTFHDVDMLLLDDRNSYGCPTQPTHMAPYTDVLGYVLWYNYLVGGVLSISVEHYRLVNGYSNSYWGWGGEDDDIGKRILAKGLKILRPPLAVGKFTMIRHNKRKRNSKLV